MLLNASYFWEFFGPLYSSLEPPQWHFRAVFEGLDTLKGSKQAWSRPPVSTCRPASLPFLDPGFNQNSGSLLGTEAQPCKGQEGRTGTANGPVQQG